MIQEEGTPDDWDPKPSEKVWYQHKTSGDFGWMVRREGKDTIRLDRPGLDEIRPYDAGEWLPREQRRPLSPAQLAIVMFMADKQFCLTTGDYDYAKKEWGSLSQRERRDWIEKGPPTKDVNRLALYVSIKKALGHLSQ